MSLTIELNDELKKQLEDRAAELNLTQEQLAEVAVRQLLAARDQRFEQLLERVIDDNEELYRRLS